MSSARAVESRVDREVQPRNAKNHKSDESTKFDFVFLIPTSLLGFNGRAAQHDAIRAESQRQGEERR